MRIFEETESAVQSYVRSFSPMFEAATGARIARVAAGMAGTVVIFDSNVTQGSSGYAAPREYITSRNYRETTQSAILEISHA